MKNTIKVLGIIALVAIIGFSMVACGDDNSGVVNLSSLLHTEGNKIINEKGEEVRLFGVNICSLEWSSKGENVLASTREAFKNWNCNLVRLPLSQDRWFCKILDDFSTPNPPDGGAEYRKIVNDIINIASRSGKYIILDLHWSNSGEWGKNPDGYCMPNDKSLEFWIDVAKRYSNNNTVLFGLYNEPHDITWEVWRNGGTVNETKNEGKTDEKKFTYHTPGHQKIVDGIRALGANNIIVAGGVDWAYDLSEIASYALKDTPEGNGIVYDSHIYPWKGLDITTHNTKVLCIADKYPILVGEIGIEPNGEYGAADNPSWLSNMLDWMDNNKLNWTAWCFHPTASPCMISNWQYTPTEYHGAIVKQRLLSYLR